MIRPVGLVGPKKVNWWLQGAVEVRNGKINGTCAYNMPILRWVDHPGMAKADTTDRYCQTTERQDSRQRLAPDYGITVGSLERYHVSRHLPARAYWVRDFLRPVPWNNNPHNSKTKNIPRTRGLGISFHHELFWESDPQPL